jgi:hypothetical protein
VVKGKERLGWEGTTRRVHLNFKRSFNRSITKSLKKDCRDARHNRTPSRQHPMYHHAISWQYRLALFSGGGIGHQAIQERLRRFREDLEAAFGPVLNVAPEAVEDDEEVDEELVEEMDSGEEDEDDGEIVLDDDMGENTDDDGEEADDDSDDGIWGDLADAEENNDILTEEVRYGYDTL